MMAAFNDWSGVWAAAFPALLCLYVMIGASVHVLRREARPEAPVLRGELPSVAVLVPARNEAKVLEECLLALLDSDHPGLEIHVLSDGSTDGTADIARRYESRGVRLHEHLVNVGKSQVLEQALSGLTSELVMVIDADTHLGRPAARVMAEVFARDPGVAGATANVRVKQAGNLLARLQVVEYASIIGLLKRANSAWGGLFTVSGAACCFRTEIVRTAGGFASPCITEDIELSWRLQKSGHRLVYVPQALVGVEVPHTLRDLWQQRVRWSQGLAEVLRVHGDVWRSRNPALAVFAVEALLGMLWAVLLVWHLPAGVAGWMGAGGPARWTPGFWQGLGMALFFCQTAMAMLYDGHYTRLPWRYLPLALVYPCYFLVLILPTSLLGWIRGIFSSNSGRWERSSRS
jgi:biofilm PGA synthesis N-glycosyltransferase PgaC